MFKGYSLRAAVLVLALGFLFSCSNRSDRVHPSFKGTFDRERSVYRSLLENNPFSAPHQPSLYAQLSAQNLRSGDVILRLMAGASSILTAFSSLGGYSHVGVIVRLADSLWVVDCQPHNAAVMGGHCVKRHNLSDWVEDFRLKDDVTPVLSVMVMRSQESFSETDFMARLDSLLQGPVHFDSRFALNNDGPEQKNLYCSEFVYVLFKDLLQREDLIFYSDPITNKLIKHVLVLEAENRYPEFCRMLHVIEERFQVKIRGVENLIAPSVFESASAFQPLCFAWPADLASSSYLPLVKMYAHLQRAVLMLRALHGLPVRGDVEAEMDYAELPSGQKKKIRNIIAAEARQNPSGFFESNRLVVALLSEYAGAEETFAMAGKAITKMERPQGHGRNGP